MYIHICVYIYIYIYTNCLIYGEMKKGTMSERPVVLYVVDDLLECVGEMERMGNILVTLVNRTPGSNVELFNNT